MDSSNIDLKITTMAIDALRESAEWFIVSTMEDAYSLSKHAKRVTLFPRDIELVLQIRREFGFHE
jgi:histone H3